MNRSVAILLAIIAISSSALAETRMWTDATGEYSFEGELVDVGANSFRVKYLETGKIFSLPIHIMSKADQDFVRAKRVPSTKTSHIKGGVPTDVASQIRQKAMREWPNDYAMQKYEIDRQNAGHKFVLNYSNPDMPPALLRSILSKARSEWPGDFAMQKYEIERQVAAYNQLNTD